MLTFLGYSICGDKNAMDEVPTNINNITITQVQNGIFDNLNVTKDVTSPYNCDIPTAWDFNTILNANFNNNIHAGNTLYVIDSIQSVKIKRRKTDTFNWITLAEVPISKPEDFKFSLKDMYNANEEEYEYAVVPVLGDNTEGKYETNRVFSQFQGVFICDSDSIVKLYAGVGYDSLSSVVKQGLHETMGSKYPIIVYNSKVDYLTGGVNGTILPKEYEEVRKIDRKKFSIKQEKVRKFLNNKRAKIIKDWNGNIWLVVVLPTPTLTYNNSAGMAIGDVSFQWAEVGDPNSHNDLYNLGFTEVKE